MLRHLGVGSLQKTGSRAGKWCGAVQVMRVGDEHAVLHRGVKKRRWGWGRNAVYVPSASGGSTNGWSHVCAHVCAHVDINAKSFPVTPTAVTGNISKVIVSAGLWFGQCQQCHCGQAQEKDGFAAC